MSEKKFDIASVYQPYPHQSKFHAATEKFRLLGGAAGPGKTYALIWEAILRSIKYDFPTVTALFRRSYPELDSTIIRTMREILPQWSYRYNQAQHIMTLFNDSIIEFCYAENDGDVIRYQSREWDFLGIDETTHFTEYQYTYLLTRLRTTKPLKTKFFGATNPGGIGHKWVKDRWVTKTCNAPGYDPKEYKFIPASVYDNPALMKANPDYISNLESLPEKERRALLHGDWDVFEGQFFSEFDHAKHVVRPFDVPKDWRFVLGWDDGTRDPRAVYLLAIDPDGRVWVIYEYYEKGETVYTAARNIRDKLQDMGYWDLIEKTVVDPSMKRGAATDGTSSIEVLESMGFSFKRGEVEEGSRKREDGWRIVKSYMTHKPYEEPLLKIFSNCTHLIETLPQMVYYQTKTGSSAKVDDLDTTLEDHAADALRYALMSIESVPARFSAPNAEQATRRIYIPHSPYITSSEEQG